jgi:hypothetical protein
MAVKPANQTIPGLSDEAKKAINATFDALSEWRDQVAGSTDRYTAKVFDNMAAAGRAMGWPEHLIEATRTQMQQASKMQLQMIEQLMNAWQHQINNPTAGLQLPTSFPGMGQIPGMGQFPGLGQVPGMGAAMPDFSSLGPMAPLQMWMQAAEMWQKSWAQAMSSWMQTQSDLGGRRQR